MNQRKNINGHAHYYIEKKVRECIYMPITFRSLVEMKEIIDTMVKERHTGDSLSLNFPDYDFKFVVTE